MLHLLNGRTRAALVLAFAGMLVLATPAGALGSDTSGERAARAAEQYYSSYGTDAAGQNGTSRAIAAERYYSSYGAPQPLANASPAAAVSEDPASSISGGLIAALLVAAAGIGVVAGRMSARRPWAGLHRREPSTP